ncbi:hypothetical protein ABZT23_27975 [Streptomyces sp. NPDC005386]|uniref:hypothetical protein n=1 Tax=Streptomyces sp. NPDC005386 TaxID=3154562 RepID=UPI0033A0C7CA
MIEPVGERTWLIGRVGNEELASEVTAWWMDEEGVSPLTVGEWSGCRDGEIFKGTMLGAAKVGCLRWVERMLEKATTDEARADLEKIADWITEWQPGDPGLSLRGGDGG